MKKLTKTEVVATHRIFNHVSDLCNNYWGRKTIQEARRYASLNRWIMFPLNNIPSLREGADWPVPNIYTATIDRTDINDDNNGRLTPFGYIGVTCGNTESMAWVQRALEPRNVSFFISTLNAMPPQWKVSIEHKIKTLHEDNTPEYDQVEEFDVRTVTANQIRDAINTSNASKLRKGSFFKNEPVLWCVTVFNVYIQTNTADFDDNIRAAFRFFGYFNLTRTTKHME